MNMSQSELQDFIQKKCGASNIGDPNQADAMAAVALAILHLSKTLGKKT